MWKNRTLRTMISMRFLLTLRNQDQHVEKPHPDSLVLQAGEKLAWKVHSQRRGRA